MSHRPIHKKKVARLRKALRTNLNSFIDLVQYLQDYGYADTAGQAKRLIIDRRVRADSHVLTTRIVHANLRRSIVVDGG